MATLVLADDHALVRVGLRRVLESGGHAVIGEVGDGLQVAQTVERLKPELLLLDLGLPGLHGLDVLRDVRRRVPATRVLVVSAYNREEYVVSALRSGAAGYVLKGSDADELLDAVRTIARGGYYVVRQLAGSLAHCGQTPIPGPDAYEQLTSRERQVFMLMAEGHSAYEVAAHLYISPRTAEVHKLKIMRKLGLRSHTDVVLLALRRGLLSLDDAGGAPRLEP
jgi:DNA-binding NarL/FixJ family response regulator